MMIADLPSGFKPLWATITKPPGFAWDYDDFTIYKRVYVARAQAVTNNRRIVCAITLTWSVRAQTPGVYDIKGDEPEYADGATLISMTAAWKVGQAMEIWNRWLVAFALREAGWSPVDMIDGFAIAPISVWCGALNEIQGAKQ
jgi:hypothetical protein